MGTHPRLDVYVVVFNSSDGFDESANQSVDGPFLTEEAAKDHIRSESFRTNGVVLPLNGWDQLPAKKPELRASELRRAAGALNYQVCRNVIGGLDLADIIDDGNGNGRRRG